MAAKPKKKTQTPPKKQPERPQNQNRRELTAIGLLIAALFGVLCWFNFDAVILSSIIKILTGLFGQVGRYILPVALAAVAGTFHPDALFAAGGLVELVHQLVEAFQLVTIVIGPHGDMGHPGGAAGFSDALRCAAAGCTAQCQCRSAQQTDECSNVLFHRNALLAFPTAAPTAAYPFNYTTLSGEV